MQMIARQRLYTVLGRKNSRQNGGRTLRMKTENEGKGDGGPGIFSTKYRGHTEMDTLME